MVQSDGLHEFDAWQVKEKGFLTAVPNDTIGNRTRDLPACSAMSQQIAPTRTSQWIVYTFLDFKNPILNVI